MAERETASASDASTRPYRGLGEATRTCRIESPPFGVGTPGTYGFHHERLLCTLLAGHPGDAHLCDEGWALSSWRGGEWSLLRRPKTATNDPSGQVSS